MLLALTALVVGILAIRADQSDDWWMPCHFPYPYEISHIPPLRKEGFFIGHWIGGDSCQNTALDHLVTGFASFEQLCSFGRRQAKSGVPKTSIQWIHCHWALVTHWLPSDDAGSQISVELLSEMLMSIAKEPARVELLSYMQTNGEELVGLAVELGQEPNGGVQVRVLIDSNVVNDVTVIPLQQGGCCE